MIGHIRKVLVPIAAAAAGATVVVSAAMAQEPAVGVTDGTAAPGGQGTVTIFASDVGKPGLGAWTLTLIYDPAVLAGVACEAADVGLNQCGPNYDSDLDTTPDAVRLAGADTNGVTGDFALATVTFECLDPTAEVDAALTLEAETFANSGPPPTPPADINPTVTGGTFSCAVPPATPTGTAAPTVIATIVDGCCGPRRPSRTSETLGPAHRTLTATWAG
jgi:hypothetical protein